MRYIIIYSIISIIVISCTAEIAREAGKAVKVIDATLQTNKIKDSEKKKIKEQKKKAKIIIIGKNQKQLVTIFGNPSLIRKDGKILSMRFNRNNCITYIFFDNETNPPKAEYFEFRNSQGVLLRSKSEINKCYIDSAKS